MGDYVKVFSSENPIELAKILENKKRPAIVGIGNIIKSDDGFGSYLAQRLLECNRKDNILVIDGTTFPENYAGKLIKFNPDILVFIDTVSMKNKKDGELVIINQDEVIASGISTHNYSFSFFIDYLKSECDVKDVFIIGISPISLSFGEEMSSNLNIALSNLSTFFIDYFGLENENQKKDRS